MYNGKKIFVPYLASCSTWKTLKPISFWLGISIRYDLLYHTWLLALLNSFCLFVTSFFLYIKSKPGTIKIHKDYSKEHGNERTTKTENIRKKLKMRRINFPILICTSSNKQYAKSNWEIGKLELTYSQLSGVEFGNI